MVKEVEGQGLLWERWDAEGLERLHSGLEPLQG